MTYLDDTDNLVGVIAACVTTAVVGILAIVALCLQCYIRRPAVHDPEHGFLRVNLTGGMRSAKTLVALASIGCVAGIATMATNVLGGVFSVVVGATVVLVCVFVAAVVLWVSWPLASVELDAKNGVISYTRYHHLVSPAVQWNKSLTDVQRFDAVAYAQNLPAGSMAPRKYVRHNISVTFHTPPTPIASGGADDGGDGGASQPVATLSPLFETRATVVRVARRLNTFLARHCPQTAGVDMNVDIDTSADVWTAGRPADWVQLPKKMVVDVAVTNGESVVAKGVVPPGDCKEGIAMVYPPPGGKGDVEVGAAKSTVVRTPSLLEVDAKQHPQLPDQIFNGSSASHIANTSCADVTRVLLQRPLAPSTPTTPPVNLNSDGSDGSGGGGDGDDDASHVEGGGMNGDVAAGGGVSVEAGAPLTPVTPVTGNDIGEAQDVGFRTRSHPVANSAPDGGNDDVVVVPSPLPGSSMQLKS